MDSLVSPQNDSVSILWNGAIGTYDLQVVEIDSNGCEGTPSIVTVNLVSQPSAISPISNITSCVNQPISSLFVPGSNINWYVDTLGSSAIFSGNTFNTGQTAINQYVYYVTETNSSGCESKYASIGLNIVAQPTVALTASSSNVCLNDSLFLTASGASSYSWFNGVLSPSQGIIVNVPGLNNFVVTGSDINGCLDTASISVQVDQLPNVVASSAFNSICLGDSVLISASGALNYQWGNGVQISNQYVSPTTIGNNSYIKSFSHVEKTKIANNVVVGPYARLRPGTILKDNTKIGNFVETKKSIINKNSKVNHLSYIGDTTIGINSNVGAGTITCNYDGVKKAKTKISDNVFIGSNSSLVAPVKIEKSSVVGAGSVITKNVKKKTLALTRATQLEIKN